MSKDGETSARLDNDVVSTQTPEVGDAFGVEGQPVLDHPALFVCR